MLPPSMESGCRNSHFLYIVSGTEKETICLYLSGPEIHGYILYPSVTAKDPVLFRRC